MTTAEARESRVSVTPTVRSRFLAAAMEAKRTAMRRQPPQVPPPPSGAFSDPEFSQIKDGCRCCVLFSSDDDAAQPVLEKRRMVNSRRKMLPLVCVMASCLVFLLSLSLLAGVRPLASPPDRQMLHLLRQRQRIDEISAQDAESKRDELLGGLLADGFDARSCISRRQSSIYRRSSLHKKPSFYLLQKLRSYEALHRKCGPGTELYRQASLLLHLNQSIPSSPSTECRYLVWISFSGLGNRILTLASSFLYALLTDRVLLIDRGEDMATLFCEPFLNQSWLLPLDFPLLPLEQFQGNSSSSLGNLLRNKILNRSHHPLGFIYLHLSHDYTHHDKLFFCQQDQAHLKNIPWLLVRSDNYFTPSLFLIPSFQQELDLLFPDKDLVFHHLGRYLFHPSNSVWGMISRFYRSYLSDAEERIGIQIRVFDSNPGPFQYIMDQVLACVLHNNLLPKIKINEEPKDRGKLKKKAVLITSLNSDYFEKIKNMYWENPVQGDEAVSVHQPSHEEHQRSGDRIHGMKAWAEIYLLSLSDVLVTSAWSTFGYVAQGLGGMRPWILVKVENRTVPEPACRRGESMEPCFHAPPFYDCEKGNGVDSGKILPHVRHCEDVSWGIKLVDLSAQ